MKTAKMTKRMKARAKAIADPRCLGQNKRGWEAR